MEKDLAKRVSERLDELVDEETTRKFGELNIVTDVSETPVGSVHIRFRTLSAYSPTAVGIGKSIRDAAMSVDGVKSVRVECGGHMMDELVDRIVNGDSRKPKKTR
ncbi:MAG TPA: iron-sulfur cluster assembly protein [Nitrososphaerales archaeon]|nr:iron-sulfur cluster assembly protein [Nitrososphaerales archaeon]